MYSYIPMSGTQGGVQRVVSGPVSQAPPVYVTPSPMSYDSSAQSPQTPLKEDSDMQAGDGRIIKRSDLEAAIKTCVVVFLGVCCLVMIVVLLIFAYVGYTLVDMGQQRYNAQPAEWTPVMFPRFNSCGGCPEGNKTDEQLEQCVHPCFNLSFVKSWESFNKENGFQTLYLPSRQGPEGGIVNISAQWLPAPKRSDGTEPPRVVALHGLGANNNHCGVQMTCFHLRSIGFSCLAPSARDNGLSGASSHPNVMSWLYDYQYDLLGAWDYAVNDPDGKLGGSLPPAKVGIMGFSKGAAEAALAFAAEPQIPGAWLDSGAYSGLQGSIEATLEPFVGPALAPILTKPIFGSGQFFSGGRIDVMDPIEELRKQCPRQRPVMISQSSLDDTVPIREAERAVVELSGLFDCYRVSAYTPPEFCNGARHHQEMWEFPDDTRVKHCSFWSRVFDQDPALCRLSSQPNFQTWSPPFYLPPGSPTE